jgi:hypothetical protein
MDIKLELWLIIIGIISLLVGYFIGIFRFSLRVYCNHYKEGFKQGRNKLGCKSYAKEKLNFYSKKVKYKS